MDPRLKYEDGFKFCDQVDLLVLYCGGHIQSSCPFLTNTKQAVVTTYLFKKLDHSYI